MTYITALEIESNWPDNILISVFENTETGRFGSVMYMLRDGAIHKKMLTLNAVYKSKEQAEEKMGLLKDFAIAYVNNKNPKAPNLSP